jgi:ELWxxDGT repeat protein
MNSNQVKRITFSFLILLMLLSCPGLPAAMGHPRLVKNINPYYDAIDTGGATKTFTTLGSSLIFSANDGTTGQELWKSDGTDAGTRLIANIRPGIYWSSPENLTTVNNSVIFTANDGVTGKELWITDGNGSGTQLLADIYPGATSSTPQKFTPIGNTLYFVAATASGSKLWKTDGTPAGTMLAAEFTPGYFSSIDSLTAVGGKLLVVTFLSGVTATWNLWSVDPVAGTTERVTTFLGQPKNLTPCDGRTFFSLNSGGYELWQTDGTDSGTLLVKDIFPGSGSNPGLLTCVGTTLFFTANDPAYGIELWKSDGTPDGTVMVKDIYSGAGSSAIDYPIELNGKLLFKANSPENGSELWQSDGTAEGTTLLADMTPGPGYSSPAPRFAADGHLFLNANGVLWVTDGTTQGTYQLSDNTNPNNFNRIGNTVYFSAYGSDVGNELWALSLEQAPFTRIISPQPGSPVNTSEITVSGEAHADAGTTVVLTEVSVNGGTTWAAATGTSSWSYSWTPSADGTYTVMARSMDSGAVTEPTPDTTNITVDTSPPAVTLQINNNASFTPYRAVTLSLTASATEAGMDCTGKTICGSPLVRFSNDNTNWSGWLAASANTQWNLDAVNGVKTVYVQVKDRAGNTSQTSASITMDTTVVPTAIIAFPFNQSIHQVRSVTVSGSAEDHSGTGLNRVEISVSYPDVWIPVTTGLTSWSHTLNNLSDGVHTVSVRVIDNAGYISQISSRTFLVDASPITGSVTINGGAETTGSSQVTLNLTAFDPWTRPVCIAVFPPPFGCETPKLYMQFSTDNVNWSVPYTYASTMSWNLGSSSTIYVKYSNHYEVASQVYSDSIIVQGSVASAIFQPTANSFNREGTIIVSGAATASPNSVTRVDVSTDNGATWQTASGTTSWSYSWSPHADGVYYLKSRATDSIGTVEVPTASVTVTIDRTPPSGTIVYDYNNDIYKLNASANDPGLICTQVYPSLCGSMQMLITGGSTWQPATATLPYGTTSLWLMDRAGNDIFINQVAQYGFPVLLEQTGTTGFTTIQEAFNSASSGNTIKLTDTSLAGNLTFGRGIVLTLRGGFNNTFSAVTGATAINGAVTVQGDTLHLQDIRITGVTTIESGLATMNNVVVQN